MFKITNMPYAFIFSIRIRNFTNDINHALYILSILSSPFKSKKGEKFKQRIKTQIFHLTSLLNNLF